MSSPAANPLIRGTTILLGDGAYWDYAAPDASGMTIEDYAWGLCKARFCNQTRQVMPTVHGGRCLYFVVQHVVMLSRAMLEDGHGPEAAFEGLMHESDEVVWWDFTSPVKPLLPPELRAMIAASGVVIDQRFGVTDRHRALVKDYDRRMLATERRDLMSHSAGHREHWAEGPPPFAFKISPWPAHFAVSMFLALYESLSLQCARRAPERQKPFTDDVCPLSRERAHG